MVAGRHFASSFLLVAIIARGVLGMCLSRLELYKRERAIRVTSGGSYRQLLIGCVGEI